MASSSRSARFLVVTHVVHTKHENGIYAYGPYVREMNLWFRHVDEVVIVAPMAARFPTAIEMSYSTGKQVTFITVPEFDIMTARSAVRTLLLLPWLAFRVIQGMSRADHIHLRCPGNMGFLGVVLSALFPWKAKTVKYAGNWDPTSQEAVSVRMQRRMLLHPLFKRRMHVLVYGEWQGMPGHVIPFFTASYSKHDAHVTCKDLTFQPASFVFVGSLEEGKRPRHAVDLAASVLQRGIDCTLDMYGDGSMRSRLEQYIDELHLGDCIRLYGAVSSDSISERLKSAHFVILLSRTEGWPKAVAEGMFHGTVPIVSGISCLPWMLDYGSRGIIDDGDMNRTTDAICAILGDPGAYDAMSRRAAAWSQRYTVEMFDEHIQNVLGSPWVP